MLKVLELLSVDEGSLTLSPAVRSTVFRGAVCALLSVFSFLFQVDTSHLHFQDVSVHVPAVLHGEGGSLPLHEGVLLGSARHQGVRRDRFLADAPGRGGADSSPDGQGCER